MPSSSRATLSIGLSSAVLPPSFTPSRRSLIRQTYPAKQYADSSSLDNPILAAPFWSGRLTAIKVLGLQLATLVWPARLSVDYGYDQIPLGSNTFNFYGTSYTGSSQLFVDVNGLISFGSPDNEYTKLDLTSSPSQPIPRTPPS